MRHKFINKAEQEEIDKQVNLPAEEIIAIRLKCDEVTQCMPPDLSGLFAQHMGCRRSCAAT